MIKIKEKENNTMSKMNGILIRPFKHSYCALIRGHKWKNTSPTELHWVCQKCTYCGKERVV